MICPFCGKEMEKGILSGDGRSKVRWKAGEKKADILDTLSILLLKQIVFESLSFPNTEIYFKYRKRKA